MGWPVRINCTACSWDDERSKEDGLEDIPMFCPECGYRTKISMEYKTPRQTKSDKI